MSKGTQVFWTSNGMPGKVVDTLPGYIQIKWASGFKSDISGWTVWCPLAYIAIGLIESGAL